MNEPVDLTEANRTLLRLLARGDASPHDPHDDVYHEHYRNLCTTMHPALAAVMAHEDLTNDPYPRHIPRMVAA